MSTKLPISFFQKVFHLNFVFGAEYVTLSFQDSVSVNCTVLNRQHVRFMCTQLFMVQANLLFHNRRTIYVSYSHKLSCCFPSNGLCIPFIYNLIKFHTKEFIYLTIDSNKHFWLLYSDFAEAYSFQFDIWLYIVHPVFMSTCI